MALNSAPTNSCSTLFHLSNTNIVSLNSFHLKKHYGRAFSGIATFNLSLARHSTLRPKLFCAKDMTAGGSDEPKKMSFDSVMDKARKIWEDAPEPVKGFPWSNALDNFIQLILDIFLTVVKYLYVPVMAVTSISEMSYSAHERKLYLILIPLLLGLAVAGILKEAALVSSPALKNAEVPWHLVGIAIFFTLIKLPGPYYPYWGRIFIPHFVNGVLLRTLWFAFSWSKRPRNATETTSSESQIGNVELDKP